jgi:hypothetical protein
MFFFVEQFMDFSDSDREVDYPEENFHDRRFYEEEDEDEDESESESESESDIEIEKRVKQVTNKTRVPSRLNEECVVCLEEFQNNDNESLVFCVYGCGNRFHKNCTIPLKRCPLCMTTSGFAGPGCS